MAKGRLVYTIDKEYQYERDGITYDLLEGKVLGSNKSSNMCFVIKEDPYGRYQDFATWFILGEGERNLRELLENCDEFVTGELTDSEKLVEMEAENKKLKEENRKLRKLIEEIDKMINS